MVYNTGNGASLQKLLDKHKFQELRQGILLLLDIKKKEIKTLNNFQQEFQSR